MLPARLFYRTVFIIFCIGPPLGAAFAHVEWPVAGWPMFEWIGARAVKGPAVACFLLLCLEFLLTVAFLPETLGSSHGMDNGKAKAEPEGSAASGSAASTAVGESAASSSLRQRKGKEPAYAVAAVNTPTTAANEQSAAVIHTKSKHPLTWLALTMFSYLLLFSGLEFTMPFLAFHILKYQPRDQGMMFGLIGVLSSLIQGGYVRRALKPKAETAAQNGQNQPRKLGRREKAIAKLGIVACMLFAVSMGLLAAQNSGRLRQHPFYALIKRVAFGVDLSGGMGDEVADVMADERMKRMFIWLLVGSMAVASATVVNGLTALSTLLAPASQRGKIGERAGWFRAVGQLGRAVGPVVGCTVYWTLGPSVWFFGAAVGLLVPYLVLSARI